MRKKLIALLMVLAMSTMLLAACGGDSSSKSTDTSVADSESTPDTSTDTDDNSDADSDTDSDADSDTDSDTDTGANFPTGEDVTLKVWGPQEEQTILKEMCEAFAAEHADNNYTFEYGVISEADASKSFSEDPAAAADVFMFANDQLYDLVKAGAFNPIMRNKDDIVSRNLGGAVESATIDGELYAYPMTADNGYFMYYDSSVFTEEDVKSLDTMLEVADAAGKKVFMDVSNGWYIASFFLGNGGTLALGEDGKQVCDFNNANGLAAAEGIRDFCAHNAFLTGDDTVLQGGMGTSIAAGVSGTWNADPLKEKLGDNYAATKLPTFNAGGTQAQMSSFGGFKLVGVNSLTNYPVHAAELADWLTNEENQTKRFEERGIGPANINVSESDAVKEDIALAALAMQSEFAVSQNEVTGEYWNPAEAFGEEMENKSTRDLQELLDLMVNQIIA